MPTIDDILDFTGGNSGLTEEFIYNNLPDETNAVPILSSATQESKYMGMVSARALANHEMRMFQGPCIVVTRNGYAGLMRLIRGKFTTNDHAYVVTAKPQWKTKLNLRWFMQVYQPLFYSLITSRTDNATFAKDYAVKQQVDIPDISVQDAIADELTKADTLLTAIRNLLAWTGKAVARTQIADPGNTYVLGDVFIFKPGNSGLTEQFMYYNLPKSDDDRLPVLTGGVVPETAPQSVSRQATIHGVALKTFHSPCILVSRKGQAGTMTYVELPSFTTNDDAYVLIPKAQWVKKVNLCWFAYQYQPLFFSLVTSKSGNATFNKEYAERQTITLPERDFQDAIADELAHLKLLTRTLKSLSSSLEAIMTLRVSTNIPA